MWHKSYRHKYNFLLYNRGCYELVSIYTQICKLGPYLPGLHDTGVMKMLFGRNLMIWLTNNLWCNTVYLIPGVYCISEHWNQGIVMMTALSSLVAPEIAVMTACRATSDNKYVTMTTLGFISSIIQFSYSWKNQIIPRTTHPCFAYLFLFVVLYNRMK